MLEITWKILLGYPVNDGNHQTYIEIEQRIEYGRALNPLVN